jgi:hypothetical protein
MNKSAPKHIYGSEDISMLVENVPNRHEDTVASMSYNIINHDAYNNPNYVWSTKDFELGTPLGKGNLSIRLQLTIV